MTWQEYQEAVGELYEQMDDIGTVHKNIYRPDKISGQKRQIDVWIEIETKNVTLGILVDAKFYKSKLDVKDIEEVLALADAVKANKAIIVAANGWSEPAQAKAEHAGMELLLLSLEDALDIIVPDKWQICPSCENDCIVMGDSSALVTEGMWSIFVTGLCRECHSSLVWCHACGGTFLVEVNKKVDCWCEHTWLNTGDDLMVKAIDAEEFQTVLNAPLLL